MKNEEAAWARICFSNATVPRFQVDASCLCIDNHQMIIHNMIFFVRIYGTLSVCIWGPGPASVYFNDTRW